ncbi:hypothetical protein [Flammeovirga agarivorans]|uniref:Uncharacterized protein n=1 Tax=Flammeovirga agarivorans TaxID=2726742 RepID=A0A7X8XZC8_9BACT|nr:hypothetical protein [Flammeovirga agarivorans]NLR95042.1 hypothetical protein [Flammeovirga agarivorans]
MLKYILSFFVILILFVSVIIYFSFNSLELVPHPEKYEIDSYLPKGIVFIPDTTISGISLFSINSFKNTLDRHKINPNIDGNIKDSVFTFSNIDGGQILKLYRYQGQAKNQFSEFEISDDNSIINEVTLKTNNNEFITENGIKLKMTIGQIKAIKGEPEILNIDESKTKFTYILDDSINNEFLKNHDIPLYYSEYSFTNGYLTKFKFGTLYQ